MKRFTVLLLFSLILFSSCNYYKDVEVNGVKLISFKLESTSKATVGFEVEVDNPLNTTVFLTTFEGSLFKKERIFADFHISDIPSVAPRFKGGVPATVFITIDDPLTLLSTGLNIKSWKADDFMITCKIALRSDNGKRKVYKFKNVPLNKVIKRFR